MLEKLNVFLQKYIAILTPLSLIVGVFLESIGHHLLFLVSWLLAFMTFSGSLHMKFKDVKIFMKHPVLILSSILFLHLLMPLWAYFLSTVLFDDHLLTVGFVLAVALPTGVTSVIWINICKGNLPLGLSIILIDTLLSPIILPFILYIVSGEKIELELNIDREEHGKKPFSPEKFEKEEWKEIKESTTDPESGYYMKDERTKQFAYSFHAATDEKGFVLGAIVTPGNVHDSHVLQPLVERVIENVQKPLAVAADAAYKTPAITNFLLENQMLPVLPYTRPKTRDGFFRKHEYIYDEHYNCYLCPQGQILKYTTTTKEGYRQYKSNPLICAKCPSLSQCTESKHHQKLIQRHIWESYVEEAEHLRHSYDIKQIYAKRKETIERVFADAKEKHGMRWTTLRGLKKLSMQAMLTFAAMNLKKLATWTWQVA
ncbi:IS1182 family transposase [Lysinibacillus sp. K60]|nr:IS1182 family transposase [Lysinibacillus sp. K60]